MHVGFCGNGLILVRQRSVMEGILGDGTKMAESLKKRK